MEYPYSEAGKAQSYCLEGSRKYWWAAVVSSPPGLLLNILSLVIVSFSLWFLKALSMVGNIFQMLGSKSVWMNDLVKHKSGHPHPDHPLIPITFPKPPFRCYGDPWGSTDSACSIGFHFNDPSSALSSLLVSDAKHLYNYRVCVTLEPSFRKSKLTTLF